ncbi:MAG: hypothetical protein HYT98_00275 [Candidatus Sungbacteria bacterium]|nr:hypothetical protein [Candidatus Sungbacteria bacterium]
MKKIILSLSVIAAVAAVVVGATTAFFSDTETSTGNTFTAGAIDLKVDSECHYYNYVGDVEGADDNGYVDVGCGEVNAAGVGVGQWRESDLVDGVHKFFSFTDIKPGDKGEDTISLHVYDNDAWGRILMGRMVSADNSCTEPETEAEANCDPDGDGELLGAMLPHFSMWLDQGSVPGFQCVNAAGVPVPDCDDEEEGDNVLNGVEGHPWSLSSELELSEVLIGAYNASVDDEDSCADLADDDEVNADGHNDYGVCHGLAADGRMVGSTTYYLGLAWELPLTTGNDVQTDSLSGDVTFEVEQHRNNPDPFEVD